MLKEFFHDFHLHTHYSDGVLSPIDLIERLTQLGVMHLALTDHENTSAFKILKNHQFNRPVYIHTGIELDCKIKSFEVHLLGLDFDPDLDPLKSYLEEVHHKRRIMYTDLLERINRTLGEDFMTPENTFPQQEGTWMKPHVFRRLAQHKQFEGIPESDQYVFFRDWLKTHGLSVTPPRLKIEEAIEFIHRAGGYAVLAHPGYYWKHGLFLPETLKDLKSLGLDGVEVFYPYYQVRGDEFPDLESATVMVRAIYHLAKSLGLKVTRGSDIHLPEHIDERYHQLKHLVSKVADFEIQASV